MKKPFYKVLYVQVLFAIACGVLLGYFEPKLGVDLKPLGDGFIKLVKMIIAPVIFLTIVTGIASGVRVVLEGGQDLRPGNKITEAASGAASKDKKKNASSPDNGSKKASAAGA